jgi:hypothetical protein
MSDTPRTDSHPHLVQMRYESDRDTVMETVPAYFARQLERALAEARTENDRLRKDLDMLKRDPLAYFFEKGKS